MKNTKPFQEILENELDEENHPLPIERIREMFPAKFDRMK